MSNQRIQVVTIKFTDGTVGTFIGPEIIFAGQTKTIQSIDISLAVDLPEEYNFETLKVNDK